jgi:ribosomal protein S18 acetylase RimI-like enzyme
MNLVIRQTEPEDAEAINRVLKEAWLGAYPNEDVGVTAEDIEHSFRDHFTPEGIARSQERLRTVSGNELRMVAVMDGRVVGVGRIIRETESNHLQTLYVHPDYQGKGIGTALWEAMRSFLDPRKDTVLEVATYNEQAIRFYERLGFRDTGERIEDERFRMQSGAIVPELRMILRRQD